MPRRSEALEMRRLLAAHIAGSSAVFQTIQAAVDAASSGATITVDAGVYPELVTVNKTLTLRGAQAGNDARSNVRRSGAASESVVTGSNLGGGIISSSFYINANNVTLDGFVVQGNTSVGTFGAGIVIAPSRSGTHVVNNIVQNNVSGLFLSNNSASNAALIQHNVFKGNNHDGANGGRGIYSDGGISGGKLTNVDIDGNWFFDNRGGAGTTRLEAAIALESRTLNSQSDIRITNNVIDNNGKSILLFNINNVRISGNIATNSADRDSGALRFEGGVSNVQILSNTIYGNPGPGIRIDEKGFTGPNTSFVVNNNNFFGNGFRFNHESVITAPGQYDGVLDLQNNFWGTASGPSGDGGGSGDAVISNGNSIDFTPFASSFTVDPHLPFTGTPLSLGATIEVEDFDHGGEGIGYHDLDPLNTGGNYRAPQGVDIIQSSNVGGGFYVGNVHAGEWLNYIVNVPQTGAYDLTIRLANSQSSGGVFHFDLDGVNVTGPITAPKTGGLQIFNSLSKSGINLSSGSHVLRLAMDTNGEAAYIANFNWFKLTPTGPSPTPAPPTNLIVTAQSPTSVKLTWQDNSSNETGFIIERRLAASATWQAITTTSANVTTFTDATASAATAYVYRVRATGNAGDSVNSNEFAVTTPPAPASDVFLSDLQPVSATSGWGPIERDTSNGGINAGDGQTITLNGVPFAKGLGVHAISDVVYNLNGAFGAFIADVGIDDEEASDGSVVFQVFADGAKVFDSGVMTPGSATQHVNVNVAGVKQLRLHVGDAGDGIDFDHADWAGARLTVAPPPPPPTTTTSTFIAAGSVWKYLDDGSNQGVAWRNNSFNDASWKSGAAQLGYGDGDETTTVSFGPDENNKFITTYFRKTLNVTSPSQVSALALRVIRDDGAVVYLNGVEIFRSNMPGGTITSTITASQRVSDAEESTWFSTSVNPALLKSGDNVIAVEVHQVDAASSDISFDLDLIATVQQPSGPPAAPSKLTASAAGPNQINLSWTDNATNETSFIIERSPDGLNGWTQVGAPAANATTFSDNSGLLPLTQYFYRVRATSGAGDSADSSVVSTTTLASSVLPAPWSDGDVGAVSANGAATFANGGFSIDASGADIWNAADALHYVYQPLVGDGQIVARVTSVENTDPWAKAGVMIRESLAAGSKHASVFVTPGNGVSFQRRSTTSGASVSTTNPGFATPYWVKLVRSGTTFSGYRSADRINWTLVGSTSIAMNATAFIGLAVTSHNTSALNTSTFDNVVVS